MDILSFVWNWDPTFVMLGNLDIRWYGLMWAIAILVAERICNYMFSREGLPPRTLESAFVWIVLGTFIGARVGHCLFYEPSFYLSNPIEILKVWEGGLASHGGAIGILIGLYIYAKKVNKPYIWILDRIVVPAAIGGAFIRIGNLMNSEIYGQPTTLPWGFKFVRDYPVGMPLENIPACHPTQIYEALFCILVFVYLLYAYYKQNMAEKRPGFMFGIFLIVVFGSRIIIEFIKNPQVEFETTMTLDMGQWLSIPFLIAGIYFVIKSFIKK